MKVEETRIRLTIVHAEGAATNILDAVKDFNVQCGAEAIVEVESWTRPLDGDREGWKPTPAYEGEFDGQPA